MNSPARRIYKARIVDARQKIEAYIEEEAKKSHTREVVLSSTELMEALGVAARTVQLANGAMATSERWEVIRGGGAASTTYRLLED